MMGADKQITLDTSKWRYASIADKDNPGLQYWDFSRLEWTDVTDRNFEFSKGMLYRVPVEPPVQWRNLEEGEVIIEGDQFLDDGKWCDVKHPGFIFHTYSYLPHRRRVKPAPSGVDSAADSKPAVSQEWLKADFRYNETKRLAEMAWQAILSDPGYVEMKPSEAAEEAWTYAEFMRIASEKRRPK